MIFVALIKGVIAGALIAVPVGPIGILCLRRTLTQGPLIGFISGLGGASADIVYATLALAGLSFVAQFLRLHSIAFRFASSLFLCGLGIKIFFSQTPKARKSTWTGGIAEAYFSTLFLTLTNPLLILSFAAIFATLKINYITNTVIDTAAIVAGVFIGSSLWWILLGFLAYFFHLKMRPELLILINKISGSMVILLSVATALSIIFA